MVEPRDLADAAERAAAPTGPYGERFAGYGVMGLPFSSGHVLALRRFPASSVGDAYTSVWHRDPSGRWTFYQDAPADRSCPRYFDAALERAVRVDLALEWTGPRSFQVSGGPLRWEVEVAATAATRMMSGMSARLPRAAWSNPRVLRAMEAVAGPALGVGRVALQGTAPNGQRFQAHPSRVWMVARSSASVDGQDLGPPGALPQQASLGDFAIPQRGVFAIGHSFFETFDPALHTAARAG